MKGFVMIKQGSKYRSKEHGYIVTVIEEYESHVYYKIGEDTVDVTVALFKKMFVPYGI